MSAILASSCQVHLIIIHGIIHDTMLLETLHLKTKYCKRIFAYNGTRLWNALSIDIRKETNMEEFKKRLFCLMYVVD